MPTEELEKAKTFIVKVQRPIGGTDRTALLIYNEDRTFTYFCQIDSEPGQYLLRRMGEKPKMYCEARMAGSIIRVGEVVEDQDW